MRAFLLTPLLLPVSKNCKLSASLAAIVLVCLLGGCSVRPPASSYLIRGNEYFKKNDYPQAEREYRDALKSEPKSATALNNLGVILNEEGKYDEAISYLHGALDVDPKNAIAHYVLSEALAKKSKFDEAFAEANAAIGLDAGEPRAYCALAEAALGAAISIRLWKPIAKLARWMTAMIRPIINWLWFLVCLEILPDRSKKKEPLSSWMLTMMMLVLVWPQR